MGGVLLGAYVEQGERIDKLDFEAPQRLRYAHYAEASYAPAGPSSSMLWSHTH